MPDPAARDPHTLVFDGNGDIWFTTSTKISLYGTSIWLNAAWGCL